MEDKPDYSGKNNGGFIMNKSVIVDEIKMGIESVTEEEPFFPSNNVYFEKDYVHVGIIKDDKTKKIYNYLGKIHRKIADMNNEMFDLCAGGELEMIKKMKDSNFRKKIFSINSELNHLHLLSKVTRHLFSKMFKKELNIKP